VFDVDALPAYTVAVQKKKIVISMPGVKNGSNILQMTLNDSLVGSVAVNEVKNKLDAVISLNSNEYLEHKIFTLKNPNRVIIDFVKNYEKKTTEKLTPAIKYTSWQKVSRKGKMQAHIIEVAPKSGYILKPVLAKGAIRGLEQLSAMSAITGALAMVNGSYFHTDGATIGLLKMNNEIASTWPLPRGALGIIGDATVIIGQPAYSGKIEFFNKQTYPISRVNWERGPNELILYNGWYDATTKTNPYGVERTILNGKVVAENINNSSIPKGAAVLSGHGAAAAVLAQLKIGDDVKITETLGAEWDNAAHIIGAGPLLVKNKNVHVTAWEEAFGADVAGGRAPRTAAGVTADGTVLLVVVDGRQAASSGMTLQELAVFMQELGAEEAVNLDGGGSSEMIVRDKIKNIPSDGRERRMGSALALIPKH
ncbi:MAG: phosphodiester glycosidase family protein, partial [Sporomusaceae bacterium]|jgi:exopolysaccharide biosynthesis protein|nr:phosphodiester glycosidase family protein [Sporomusaceae bacterium]